MSEFRGASMHTALWDHSIDLTNKRVAIVGTGASSIQVVPAIAPVVAHLSVFQRPPIWVAPRPDRKLHASSLLRTSPLYRRAGRAYTETFLEILTFVFMNYDFLSWPVRWTEWLLRWYMRGQVKDPNTAEKLIPTYALGCKRPATSNTYLTVSYTHLRAHETPEHLVCRLLLEKKKKTNY
eukprot:TRINITY_DN22898_c0_g1_i2.p1 TRINITY_DN22898_c0_g1~~TRINITY_DN22898_c0_g1_i2.p1  ORF type:complete len:180 (-),score=33.14 TRINITY_DN22898_c0_g1_i2:72-611(-)